MQQVQLVDEPMSLQQAQSAIHGDAINVGIDANGFAQDLRGIEMLGSGFDDLKNDPALAGHTDSASEQRSLQGARDFSFRERHELSN
jgi:hypothetical protein